MIKVDNTYAIWPTKLIWTLTQGIRIQPLCHSWLCFPLISWGTLSKYYSFRTFPSYLKDWKEKTRRDEYCILLRSSVLESGTWGTAATADNMRALLPRSGDVASAAASVLGLGLEGEEGVRGRGDLACFLWTACTFEEANWLTVTVSAINKLCPIELIVHNPVTSFFLCALVSRKKAATKFSNMQITLRFLSLLFYPQRPVLAKIT